MGKGGMIFFFLFNHFGSSLLIKMTGLITQHVRFLPLKLVLGLARRSMGNWGQESRDSGGRG